VDLAGVNLELFPHDEGIALPVGICLAEIHAQEHDTKLFVDG